jgi:hypothetical protein
MNEETHVGERKLRRVSPAMMAAIAAGIVSACALAVSIYEAYLMREQQQAAVMPILEAWSFYAPDVGFGLNVANKGIGPALLKSVDVSLDGEPKSSWRQIYDEVLGGDAPSYSQSMITGNVLAPGERVTPFQFSPESEPAILWRGSERVSLRICFCSVFDQCWEHRLDNLRSGVPRTEEIEECRVDRESHF